MSHSWWQRRQLKGKSKQEESRIIPLYENVTVKPISLHVNQKLILKSRKKRVLLYLKSLIMLIPIFKYEVFPLQIYIFCFMCWITNPRMKAPDSTGPLEKVLAHPRLCLGSSTVYNSVSHFIVPIRRRRNYLKRKSSRSCQQSLKSATLPLHLPRSRASILLFFEASIPGIVGSRMVQLCPVSIWLFLNQRTRKCSGIIPYSIHLDNHKAIWPLTSLYALCGFSLGFSLRHDDLTMLSKLALNLWT